MNKYKNQLFSIMLWMIFSSFTTKYPEIPRLDIHMHKTDTLLQSYNAYNLLRDTIFKLTNADIALFVNLEKRDLKEMSQATNGRMLGAFNTPKAGINGIVYRKKKDIRNLLADGYMGYKIWYGPVSRQNDGNVKYPYIDDKNHKSAFKRLEKEGVLLTSVHIADPNGPFDWRTPWQKDPIDFWRQIRAFENVLKSYPNLRVIAAHGAWLMTQDAQLDYLRYLLDTYPQLNLDVSATMEYSNLQNYDNLRSFYIEYQDRLIWASDLMFLPQGDTLPFCIKLITYWFRFLETDDVFGADITSNGKNLKGLNLPVEVLKKIYYKNSLRLYPKQLSSTFKKLGYNE